MSDRELLAEIHETCANCLAMAKMPLPDSTHREGLFGVMEQIWSKTRDAWEEETGMKAEKP